MIIDSRTRPVAHTSIFHTDDLRIQTTIIAFPRSVNPGRARPTPSKSQRATPHDVPDTASFIRCSIKVCRLTSSVKMVWAVWLTPP